MPLYVVLHYADITIENNICLYSYHKLKDVSDMTKEKKYQLPTPTKVL